MTTPTPAPQPARPPEPDWQLLWADDEAQADRRKLGMTDAEIKRTVFVWEKALALLLFLAVDVAGMLIGMLGIVWGFEVLRP